jgi:hypothetical protein
LKWLGSTVFTGTSRIDRFKICLSLPITSFRAFYTLMKDSQDEWLAEGISTTVARHLKDAGYSDISEAFYVATHQTPAPPVTITLTLIIHSFILCSAFVCVYACSCYHHPHHHQRLVCFCRHRRRRLLQPTICLRRLTSLSMVNQFT